MAGKTLDIYDIIIPEKVAIAVSDNYVLWENKSQIKREEWEELQKYVFATDTTKTGNAKLPWNNKTTIPKLCQIRDNLLANYLAAMFPKRKWLTWLGATKLDAAYEKKKSIEMYMGWAIENSNFYKEMAKLVLDYIDYGNCFAMPSWDDERVYLNNRDQTGYVGPSIKRISPLDLVFNPVGGDFAKAPKIIRSIVTIGEAKQLIEQQTGGDDKDDAEDLFNYMLRTRANFSQYGGHSGLYTAGGQDIKDSIYNVSGFDDWKGYLGSDYVELLTFYGDIFDDETATFFKNQIVTVVDRHRLVSQRTNPSAFGYPPVYHSGWRIRQDNLWAMGPLDNLVGMQYRIDHLENLKADVFDQIAFPPLKIKGYVEDFEWGPFERIYVGDDGDVEVMSPDVQALQADNQIALLEMKMEEMAGSPKEAMGFRTPGEKTAFEVQRLENAASRIFQSKISQFEMQVVEPLLNGMLELAKRKMDETTVRAFDPEMKLDVFSSLTKEDISGNGVIKPIAARHFAEQASLVQDMNAFMASAAYADPDVKMHFSGYKMSRFWETALNLEDYEIVNENIRLSEKADAQKLMNEHAQQIGAEGNTPAGIAPEDSTEPF